MGTTYAEFQASSDYTARLAGAQCVIDMVCDVDPTLRFTAHASFGFSSSVEQIEAEECGNEGASEIITGRVRYTCHGSLYVTSQQIDQRMPTRDTFLERQPWTVTVYDGQRWPAAKDASPDVRVRYQCTGVKWESWEQTHQASGDVQASFSGKFLSLVSGEEYAAASEGG